MSVSAARLVTISVTDGQHDTTICNSCFAALDTILTARSNAFASVIADKRAVPTNATCPQYHVLVFRTLSKSLGRIRDSAADNALALAAECVLSELEEELTARSADTALLFPSKWTTSANKYIAIGRFSLNAVRTSTDNASRAKYLAAAAAALVKADRSITNGNLCPP